MPASFGDLPSDNKPVRREHVGQYYVSLPRYFFAVQNAFGYESQKSKGLDTIQNDSLRTAIISLNEYDFKIIKHFEE